MNKSIKIFVFFLLLIFIGILVVEAKRSKPIDWTPTFNTKDKKPYGLFVFDKEKATLFKNNTITKLNRTPYEYLDNQYQYEENNYKVATDFIYINNEFDIDTESVQELIYYASHGNNIFISCANFSKRLQDSLYFELDTYPQALSVDSLKAQVGENSPISMYKGTNNMYFKVFDSINTTILGTETINNKTYPNFIKIKRQEGAFYLHTQPYVFTNYYLLQKDKYKYVEELVSPLNGKNFTWYIKKEGQNKNGSMMQYILSQPALRYAWYLSLLLAIIFIVFNAKRRQRVIPIKERLKNTTVDFTKTIGNLYFLEKNHLNIIDKKIIYFLEKVRSNYHIDTHKLDEQFVHKLHLKTNKSKADIERVVFQINRYQKIKSATENDLLVLNQAIENLNI